MDMMKTSIAIAVLIVVIGIVTVFFIAPEELTPTPQQPSQEETPQSQEPVVLDPETRKPITTGGSFGGGESAGGGGGDSGTSSSSTPGDGCYLDPSSYALAQKVVQQNCTSVVDTTCVAADISCAIIVENLDSSQSGLFTLLAKLHEVGTSPANPHDSEELTIELAPGGSSLVEHVFSVSGADAEKDWTCTFSAVSVPAEEIC